MTAYTTNCPPADCGPCGALPSGFVRLRYFYGKRLNVADFLDEQRYHSGKLRFHNQRLHGSGVLCGLAVDHFSNAPADARILRVHRGAAIDGCGRELIVGWDQCIDIDAWLGRKLVAQPDFLAGLPDPTKLPLCVVVRYHECPSSPEAAPRDACACDAGGCDYGRVREEFELDLIMKPDPTIAPAIFPPRDKLLPALALAPGAPAIVERIAALASVECPAPDPDGWIEIACFVATLVDAPVGDPAPRKHVASFDPPVRATSLLYETALLQELLVRQLAATLEAGALADGPEVATVALDSPTSPSALVVTLTGPVLDTTVPQQAFELRPFDPATGWGPPVALAWTLDATKTVFTLAPAGSSPLATDGARLRLASIVDAATPIADTKMRPLLPLRFSFHFAVRKDPATSQFSLVAPPLT